MLRRIIVSGGLLSVVVLAVFAGVALAQLSDSQSAGGTITATSTSADIYICEPSAAGPDCGSDDSGADEEVFETIENIQPGETVQWDIRLKNVGVDDLTVNGLGDSILEITDPGNDCTNNGMLSAGNQPATGYASSYGVFILGGHGDDSVGASAVPGFKYEGAARPVDPWYNIKIAPGDYEDVRLRLQLSGAAGNQNELCDGNEWSVSWRFDAS